MPHIPTLLPDQAPEEVRELYEDFGTRMAFPAAPNFIMTQGHSAAALRGTWGLVQNTLLTGKIPRWVKELIFVAISKDRNCNYCVAAHVACCRVLGVKPEILDAMLRNLPAVSDARLHDIVSFCLKCSRNPQSITAADIEKLKRHRLNDSEIVELISMAVLAVYANIMADATAMDADKMFSVIGTT